MPTTLRAPKGKFRVVGIDLFDHNDYLVGDYKTRKRAFYVADQYNMKRSSSMDDIYYVYNDRGIFIRGNKEVDQKISP